jgi:hypothetical protein
MYCLPQREALLVIEIMTQRLDMFEIQEDRN